MRIYISLVVGAILGGCSFRDNRDSTISNEALQLFYDGNLSSFKRYVTTEGQFLIDSLLASDTLILKNKYEIYPIAIEHPTDFSSRMSFLRQIDKVKDTVYLRIKEPIDGETSGIDLDEATLFDLLKHEDSICSEIGVILFKYRKSNNAFKWLQISSGTDGQSKYYLGIIHKSLHLNTEALIYFEDALKYGYKDALKEISVAYSMSGDTDKAIVLLKAEAEKGNDVAMLLLGGYYNATSPPADATPLSSFHWFEKAAQLGNSDAMVSLGGCYEFGKYSVYKMIEEDDSYTIDLDSAYYWYTKAAGVGNGNGMLRLAQFYLKGTVVDQDTLKGLYWLELAKKKDRGASYFEIGEVYRYGIGVKIDEEKALEYYKISAQEEFKVAELNVKELEEKLARN